MILLDIFNSILSTSSEEQEEINWIGLVAVPIAAICSSLLFVPAPFLRTLNGVPLSLYTSSGLLIGALIGWAVDKFDSSMDGSFFHPAMMIGGCGFTLFFIFGVFAVRLLGIAGAGSVLSGAAVIILCLINHFGFFALSCFNFPSVEKMGAEDPKWLVYAAAIITVVGVVLGMFVTTRDGMESPHSGYNVISAINSELGTYNEDDSDIESLLDQQPEKKKKRVFRPGDREARDDSAITRWFIARPAGVRRVLGIIFALLAAASLAIELSWLRYAQEIAVSQDSSMSSLLVESSSSSLKVFHGVPFCDLFTFACGAFVSSVFFVVVFGLIACNEPSLPPQGALPCVLAGILYAIALLAWLFARVKLVGPLGDATSWGITPLFTALWGLFLKEQKGVSGHFVAAISVSVTIIGSTLLGLAQRGFHSL